MNIIPCSGDQIQGQSIVLIEGKSIDMDSEILHLNPESQKEIECRQNIDFYIRHLDLKELKVVQELCKMLAINYSDSYQKWNDPNFGG